MWSRAELSAYHVIRELLPQRPPLPPNLQMHDSSGSRIPNGWHTSTRTRSKCRCRCTLSLQWAAIVDITALALMPLCCCCFYCNRALVKNVNLKTYWPRERKRSSEERERDRVWENMVWWRTIMCRCCCCFCCRLCQCLCNFSVFCYCGFLHYCVCAFT